MASVGPKHAHDDGSIDKRAMMIAGGKLMTGEINDKLARIVNVDVGSADKCAMMTNLRRNDYRNQ